MSMVVGKGFRIAALAAVAALSFAASTAKATSVDFTTSGVFGSLTNVITSGGITITYTPSVETNVQTPSIVSLGEFTVTGLPGSGTAESDSFSLSVTQTLPTVGGTATFGTGTVSGIITFNSSNATVVFTSPLSVTIASSPAVTYTLPNQTILLTDPSGNPDTTTIQGQVTAVPVPVAAYMGGSTLLGLGALGAFRKRLKLA